MSSLQRFPLLKLPYVPSNLVFRLMDAKYCIILLSSGKRLTNLVRQIMGRPTRFSLMILPISHIARASYHIQIDFPNTPTVDWSIYPHRDEFVGPRIDHTIDGCELITFDEVDSYGQSCFETFFPEAASKVSRVINWLVGALKTNLTNITFHHHTGRNLQTILNWDQVLLADHVHFDRVEEQFFELNVFNHRLAAGKRTTFEHVVFTDSAGITASQINNIKAKVLVLGPNTLSVDEAFSIIQGRLQDNAKHFDMLSFSTNHWRNGEFEELQSRLATSPLPLDYKENYHPEAPFWLLPITKQGTRIERMIVTDEDDWVFYFSSREHFKEGKIEMVRWNRHRPVEAVWNNDNDGDDDNE